MVGLNNSKSDGEKDRAGSRSPENFKCIKCGIKGVGSMKEHKEKQCLLFTNCVKCLRIVEVNDYNNHLLKICTSSGNYTQCKKCKEPIETTLYENHISENACKELKNSKVPQKICM